ncbi:hypothetical protein V5799_020360 [Amblyomma americanum]|uniref:Uncharacterized protein n=1 Tax=Amblyomma americanum TaxID=6943 RepID=A0AAQ4EUA3_AMBAM
MWGRLVVSSPVTEGPRQRAPFLPNGKTAQRRCAGNSVPRQAIITGDDARVSWSFIARRRKHPGACTSTKGFRSLRSLSADRKRPVLLLARRATTYRWPVKTFLDPAPQKTSTLSPSATQRLPKAGENGCCSAKPLNTFDLKKILGCGFNADAWSLWIPPNGYAYCQRDSIDISDMGDYTCYSANSTGHCRMVP